MLNLAKILQSIDLPWMGGEGGGATKSVLGSQKTKKTIFGHVRYLFVFYFFPRTLNSFTLLGTDQNRSNPVNRLKLAANWVYMSGDELGSKFSYTPFWGRGCWGVKKHKNCPFFNQSIQNQKLYNISKNKPPKSIRRGDMGFPLSLTSKKCCSSRISPPNRARKLKLGMYI